MRLGKSVWVASHTGPYTDLDTFRFCKCRDWGSLQSKLRSENPGLSLAIETVNRLPNPLPWPSHFSLLTCDFHEAFPFGVQISLPILLGGWQYLTTMCSLLNLKLGPLILHISSDHRIAGRKTMLFEHRSPLKTSVNFSKGMDPASDLLHFTENWAAIAWRDTSAQGLFTKMCRHMFQD